MSLRLLPRSTQALGLGSRGGSLARLTQALEFSSITIGPDAPDAEVPRALSRLLVAARTEALPFRDWHSQPISNHSLEHFERL